MMALQFLGSKMGAWVVVGVLVVALGATWKVQQWRIEARDGQIDGLRGEVQARTAERDAAVGANARYKETLDRVTADLEEAKARAARAVVDLAAARGRVEVRTVTITKEATRAATLADDAPAPPGLRAVLRGLRDAYGTAGDRARTAAGGESRPAR